MSDKHPLPVEPNADMGITANAVLLLGLVAGALIPPYGVIKAIPNTGELVIENRATGNTYRLSVVQLTGAE